MKKRVKHASSPWPWGWGTECGLTGKGGVTDVPANVTCLHCIRLRVARVTKTLESK